MAAALTFTVSGCSDFLDEPILGQQDMENYFSTEDECAKQVTGCYQSLTYDDWWQIYKFYVAGDMCTDDEWMGNTTQEPGDYLPLSHYTGNTIEGGNAPIKCWNTSGHGSLNFFDSLKESCNPAFMEIGRRLHSDKFCFSSVSLYFHLLSMSSSILLYSGVRVLTRRNTKCHTQGSIIHGIVLES